MTSAMQEAREKANINRLTKEKFVRRSQEIKAVLDEVDTIPAREGWKTPEVPFFTKGWNERLSSARKKAGFPTIGKWITETKDMEGLPSDNSIRRWEMGYRPIHPTVMPRFITLLEWWDTNENYIRYGDSRGVQYVDGKPNVAKLPKRKMKRKGYGAHKTKAKTKPVVPEVTPKPLKFEEIDINAETFLWLMDKYNEILASLNAVPIDERVILFELINEAYRRERSYHETL